MTSAGRVLLVEDEELVARPLTKALSRSGFDVAVATTIGDAVEALEGADSRQPFRFVVLDLGLPDGDGEAVLDHCETLANHPKVVVVAAPQNVDCRRMVAFADRCDYLPKPLIFESLLTLLRRKRHDSLDAYGKEFGLSEREVAVLKATVHGLDLDGTAAALGCRPGTVRTYWARLLKKTNAGSRAQSLGHVIRWMSGELARARPHREGRLVQRQG
jgi:DNA-binding NarL/FixJ family response regulator